VVSVRRIPIFVAGLALACTGAPALDEGGQTTTTANDAAASETSADTETTGTQTDMGAPEAALVIVVRVDQAFAKPALPGAGASVAVDTTGGRIEVIADAEGRAVIDGFSWSDEPGASIDVTAGALETSLRSHLGVVEADTEAGEFEIHVTAWDTIDDRVWLSGGVTNSGPNHNLLVTATGGVSFDAADTQWSMLMLPSQPFTLVALELDYLTTAPPRVVSNPIFSWVALTHPGITEPTELLVDFTMPTPSAQLMGAFEMPGRPDSPLRGDSFGFVQTYADLGTGPIMGRASYTEVTEDGELCSFEYDYLELDGLDDPLTCYRVLVPPLYEFASTACEPGYPSAAVAEVDLIDTLHLPFVADRGLHDPIEFEIFDADVTPTLLTYYGPRLIWQVSGPVDASSITVPAPPAGFGAEDVTLTALLHLYRHAPGGEYVERFSTSQPFELET
jgi:hypothetical protein